MAKLAHTQSLFWQLIRAPDGVEAALGALPDRERTLPGGIDAWVCGDERLRAVERLEVYAGMYFFRLLGCLAEDFAAVHAVVGHQRFHALVRDYLERHPSTSRSVRLLGRFLAGFLEGHPLGAEHPHVADLARFEWALLEAFDARDAEPLAPEALKSLPADRWPGLRLTLAPSLRVVEALAPVQEVWAAVTGGQAPPRVERRRTVIRVWREELRVFHRVIGEVELAALRAIERGAGFAAACEAASAFTGEEEAPLEVARLLERWLADRLLVAADASPSL
jgi:Putative DNA-binding domain